ncbi:hypothetical protein C4580_01335 [Candidatus Woesearchaeota archaeon]|nr:MAG: hypothetical protein C4580_01335 [Candidatus Woesearchaeota archaeon]
MNKNVVIAIVLGALVLIAGVQAFQLFSLKNTLAQGQYSTTATAQAGTGASNPQLPSNLQNLPSMVGGC